MRTRRTHSPEFKQSAVAASEQSGASIASVAMAYGINAHQLYKWQRQQLAPKPVTASTAMIPIALLPEPSSAPLAQTEGTLDIQFSRARVSVRGRIDLEALHTILTTLRS